MSGEQADDIHRRAVAALAPLRWMEGTWAGIGTAHGEPVTGRLTARAALGDSFLEVRERLTDSDGNEDHEDVCYYRQDPERGLRVLHLMAPATVVDREVRLLPSSDPGVLLFRWYENPFSPRVDFAWNGTELRLEVWLPFEPAPQVSLLYRRLGPT